MQVLGQGLQDALAPQNNHDRPTDILKVLQCFVWSKILLNLRSKLLTDDVIKNVCDDWFGVKQQTHSQFESSIQNTSFFQNFNFGSDVTNNDVINF